MLCNTRQQAVVQSLEEFRDTFDASTAEIVRALANDDASHASMVDAVHGDIETLPVTDIPEEAISAGVSALGFGQLVRDVLDEREGEYITERDDEGIRVSLLSPRPTVRDAFGVGVMFPEISSCPADGCDSRYFDTSHMVRRWGPVRADEGHGFTLSTGDAVKTHFSAISCQKCGADLVVDGEYTPLGDRAASEPRTVGEQVTISTFSDG